MSRQQYATETTLIRVMCSGRVDLDFVLRAFANGMDGVYIAGCRLNECNYTTHGNYDALNMVLLCRKIMAYIGLNPERLRIEFMSGGEGIRFAEVTNDVVKVVRELGPLGAAEGIDIAALRSKLAAVRKLVPYIKLTMNDKLATRLQNSDDYETLFTTEEVDALFRDVVSYYIDPEKCEACMICARRCPAEAIVSAKGEVHVILQDKCIKCGICLEACPPRFNAVRKISGEAVPPPLPEGERAVARKTS